MPKQNPEYPNLRSWQPGESGNPKGRPKGAKIGLRVRLMQLLEKNPESSVMEVLEKAGIDPKDRDNATAIALAAIAEAIQGNISAAKYISEQTDMPLTKSIDLNGSLEVRNIERRIIDPAD